MVFGYPGRLSTHLNSIVLKSFSNNSSSSMTYDRPLRKIRGRGPRCPEVRPRPPPMNEDGRRTAPMTMRDEPASGPAEAGGLDKLNGGE